MTRVGGDGEEEWRWVMGCRMCEYTGFVQEYDETAGPGRVDVPCPDCQSMDGTEPRGVQEMMDVCLQAEIDAAWAWHERREIGATHERVVGISHGG